MGLPAADRSAAGPPAKARRGRPGYDLDTVVRLATDVFTQRGYDGTTMDDLAAALGITKSAIYHHVSGKKDILRRALDRALDALDRALDEVAEEVAQQGGPAAVQLERAVRASVATLVAELPSVTLLLRVRGNSEVERAALERRRAIDTRLAELVRQAAADGALRRDIEPATVARLVFGTVNSIAEWYRPREADVAAAVDARSLADAVCGMVFGGLRVANSAIPSPPS